MLLIQHMVTLLVFQKIAKILVQTKMTGLRTLHGVVRVTVLNQLRKVLIKIDQRKTRMLCSKFLLP